MTFGFFPPPGLCWEHDMTESLGNIQSVEVTTETSATADALIVVLTV